MEEEVEKRKSSIEIEMEKYLETELGKLDITNEIPLDLTVKKTSNPDVTVNPQPPTTNTTTIQAPLQPDLNKESTTTPVFNTTSQQQQHNSHYETKEIDIDSQLDSLKSTDSARSDELVSNDTTENLNKSDIDNLKKDTTTVTTSDSNSVKIIVNSNEMISENSTDTEKSHSSISGEKPEKCVTIIENASVAAKHNLHNVVKIKINSESFDSDNDRKMETNESEQISVQPPGAENSPPEKCPPNPPLSLNCSITPKRAVTPSGSGIATPVRSGTPSRGMETPQRSGTPSGAGSPNSVQLTPPDLIPENARSEQKVSPPSRIPSRKSSHASTSINEDLKKLESKLEKFMPKAGSDLGSETSELSEGSNRSSSSSSNIGQRLHHGQTASTRAKASELKQQGSVSMNTSMTSSFRGRLPESLTGSFKARKSMAASGSNSNTNTMTSSSNTGSSSSSKSSSPPDKTGTASMLKTTLRKMSRFSMGSKSKKDAEVDCVENKGIKSPDPKPRGRPSSGGFNSNTIGRSKSFKEPEPPKPQPLSSRNQPYTSSLRRTKTKAPTTDKDPSQVGNLQRTNTGGQLDRGGMRRSISASRGGPGARIVKKSRTVQTQLTLDAGMDNEDVVDGASTVQFQVWLPDLLGEETDKVETHVENSNEPVDVRKNRQLTLENMKLHREIDKLKTQVNENDVLKKEIANLKVKLEEEQKSRLSIQKDLEQNHERVRAIMMSMDTVEKEWENRAIEQEQLEQQLEAARQEGDQLRQQLQAAMQAIQSQKTQLEKSLSLQKTLMSQLQDTEAEARELQDFLQAEKSTLSEALKENEQEVLRLRGVITEKDEKLAKVDEQTSLLVRRAEQRSQELLTARAELTGTRDRAREMLLAQGAELSRASIALSQIFDKLEAFAPIFAEDKDGDVEEVSESSDSQSQLEYDKQVDLAKNRRHSQFLVTPTENLDVLTEFSKALMSVSTGSDQLQQEPGVENSISTLATAIADRKNTDRKNSETLSQCGGAVPSLADQITQLSSILSILIAEYTTKSALESSATTREAKNNLNNLVNLNGAAAELPPSDIPASVSPSVDLDIENVDLTNLELTRSIILEQNRYLAQLKSMVKEKEENMSEMKNKFSKHRQILTSNWQQAEDEVRKVDDIYHSTIDKVISTVESLPETLSGDPALVALVTSLRQEQLEAETVVKAENLANGNAVENNKSAAAQITDGINGNQQLSNGNLSNNGLSPPQTATVKSKSDLLLSLSCRDTLSNINGGVGKGTTAESTTVNGNSNGMSQSMLIESCHSSNRNNINSNGIEVGGIRLKGGVLSEPCLQKAPLLGGLPTTTLLTSPERLKQQEDLNANQSL